MNDKICQHCKTTVIENVDNYETFENMHWLCFHLVYEHDVDPDTKCSDPSCPWWHIEVLRNELKELKLNPDKVIEKAIDERWKG